MMPPPPPPPPPLQQTVAAQPSTLEQSLPAGLARQGAAGEQLAALFHTLLADGAASAGICAMLPAGHMLSRVQGAQPHHWRALHAAGYDWDAGDAAGAAIDCGNTALLEALAWGASEELVRFLVTSCGRSPLARNAHGHSVFHALLFAGNGRSRRDTRHLLHFLAGAERGKALLWAPDLAGTPPALLAARMGRAHELEFMLGRAPPEALGAVDCFGMGFAGQVCFSAPNTPARIQVAHALLLAGGGLLNARADPSGNTLAHWAVLQDDEALFGLLCAAAVDCGPAALDLAATNGSYAPLHLVFLLGRHTLLHALLAETDRAGEAGRALLHALLAQPCATARALPAWKYALRFASAATMELLRARGANFGALAFAAGAPSPEIWFTLNGNAAQRYELRRTLRLPPPSRAAATAPTAPDHHRCAVAPGCFADCAVPTVATTTTTPLLSQHHQQQQQQQQAQHPHRSSTGRRSRRRSNDNSKEPQQQQQQQQQPQRATTSSVVSCDL